MADDFGLCEKHDNVIMELIKHKKINAVSVMVHPDLKCSNRIDLLKIEKNLTIGLHLNFTILLPNNKITNTSSRLLLNNFILKNNNKIINFEKCIEKINNNFLSKFINFSTKTAVKIIRFFR